MVDPISFLDLPAQKARLGDKLQTRLDAVFKHCHFVMGPEVYELEKKLAAYSGARHAVAVSSGTDALLAVMMAEGIGSGMAVFLPAFTYTATAEIIMLLGACPVFVDIDANTFQISLSSLSQRFSDVTYAGRYKPAAIIGVDLFGQPAPWKELQEFSKKHDLILVDDCAQSFGASYQGRKLGREAQATTLSFFPSKPLGCYGDGGAILTDDDERADLYRSLRSHGEGKQRYDVQRIGLNARLDTLQAAVLLVKMDVFERELVRRSVIARLYDEGLPKSISSPVRVVGSESAWAIYNVMLSSKNRRDSLQTFLKERAIPTAIYYPKPLHFQPAYAQAHDGAHLPISEECGQRVLALPIHPDLSDDQIYYIIEIIKEWDLKNYDT